MLAYHDEEWGVPLHDDRALFELLYIFLYVVGEEVPEYDDWCKSRGREHSHAAH